MTSLTIDAPGGALGGYLSDPSGSGRPVPDGGWPGVVVVHDLFGLSDDIRAIVDRFATAGYLALAPDLYSRGGFARCVKGVFTAMRQGRGQAVEDVLAARQVLLERPDCSGRIGVAGFCMGGGFALVAAPRGFDASAPYYGMLPEPLPEALAGACPVVASYGGRDRQLAGAAGRLESALTELQITHDVKEYPQAGHSFANRIPFGPFGPVARIAGMAYHHDSAQDSWQRVLAFFAEHLADPAPAG